MDQRRGRCLWGAEERHPAGTDDDGSAALGQRPRPRGRQAALGIARARRAGPRGPAVEAALLDQVDLVVTAEPEVAGRAVAADVEPAAGIERQALGIAEAPGVNLSAAAVLVDAHHLAAQAVGVGRPRRHEALAGREVQPAVRPELESPAEVVARAAGDAVHDDLLAGE